jgi:pimeloyl-ACP methyl ester carboxylesterase
MAHRTFPAAVALALALSTSACSGDDSGPAPSPSGPSTPAAITVPGPTVAPSAGVEPGPFEITTSDGLTLEAERFGTGDVFVVLAHMRPSDMASWFSFAGLVAGEGYSAVAFNFRGYGNSEGAGFSVDTDVRAAVDAARRLGATDVVVIGASMGGTGALAAAADRDVAGVITLSAPADFMGVDAAAALAAANAPVLAVAAAGDEPYASDARSFAAAHPDRVDLLELAGRSHGTDLFFTESEALTAAILGFIAAVAPAA